MVIRMSRILVIEDEPAISKMLCLNLGMAGYETTPLADGEEALSWLRTRETADLALVDVMLPKVDGFQLLEPLSARNIPVIYLTALGDIESKLKGLTGGAEDYIVKPFEMPEVLARIEKTLSRRNGNQDFYRLDDVEIRVKERSVKKGGVELSMTPIEFDLLLLLVKNQGTVLSREKMLSEVWNFLYEGGTRTVDVHIAQLRKKTGLKIVSYPKIGYRLQTGFSKDAAEWRKE